MLFALDANVWLKEVLLRSAVGVAFLHAIRRLKGRLLLPDSTRMEILAGVERRGCKAVAQVEAGFTTVQSLLGHKASYSLPSAVDFRNAAESRLDELGDLILCCEITHDLHRRALTRVTNHLPPAETSEQYRDCLMWECLLEATDECLLVSADGDFVDKSTKGVRLAPSLAEESKGRARLYESLADALKAIEPQLPPVNLESTTDTISAAIQPVLLDTQEQQGWRAGSRIAADVELYATERAGTTTAVFRLRFNAYNLHTADGVAVDEGIVDVMGECLIDDSHNLSDLRLDRIALLTLDGMPLAGGGVYFYGNAGAQRIPYTVRARLPIGPT